MDSLNPSRTEMLEEMAKDPALFEIEKAEALKWARSCVHTRTDRLSGLPVCLQCGKLLPL